MNPFFVALVFSGLGACALSAQGSVLFHDDFDAAGTKLDLSEWTTEIGIGSYLGRTQLADWVTPGGIGQFVVTGGSGRLTLDTYNPTGFSLFGTHAKTLSSFQPVAGTAIEFTTRLRLTSLQPGIVFATYLYECVAPNCATHDEIDIELVTNLLQPGGALKVQVNRYANEPFGAGNGGLIQLPAGFDPLASHAWTIRWSLSRVDYLVDGVLLASETSHVPQGPMRATVIAWGPDQGWPTAYDSSLQPVASAAQNQSFVARVESVTVSGGPDGDGDGVIDTNDNCPFAGNGLQQDRGGIGAAAPPDGIGDTCQCGDVTGDGRVTSADAITITRALLVPPTATLAQPALCDVGGNSGCTSADAVIVTRAQLVPATASVAQACAAATP